jgi:hypothetical protein
VVTTENLLLHSDQNGFSNRTGVFELEPFQKQFKHYRSVAVKAFLSNGFRLASVIANVQFFWGFLIFSSGRTADLENLSHPTSQ